MKRYAIRRLYSYFETTEDEITSNVFDEKLDSLDKEIKLLLEKYGLKYISQDMRFIASHKMSVIQCNQCENLMLNRDKNHLKLLLLGSVDICCIKK